MTTNKSMRNKSHSTTVIAKLVNSIQEWKHQAGMTSREAVADAIVQTHQFHGFNDATGIKFDYQSGDEYQRMHTNANRIYRWLDELTKDTNLLPANFIPSILLAMPIDIRLKTVNRLLDGLELTAQPLQQVDEHEQPLDLLRHILKETGDVSNAYADLVDGIDPGELEQALEASNSAINALTLARDQIQSMRTREMAGEIGQLKAVK